MPLLPRLSRIIVELPTVDRGFGRRSASILFRRSRLRVMKGEFMKVLKPIALIAFAGGILFAPVPKANAQVAVSIGPAPVCPYGYYEVPPYNCAPYGYYGPEWFSGGVFIGAGP